jgi:hypothetical protein
VKAKVRELLETQYLTPAKGTGGLAEEAKAAGK